MVPVTVNAPAVIMLLDTWTVLAITVPRNTAPFEEDKAPLVSTVPDVTIEVGFINLAVLSTLILPAPEITSGAKAAVVKVPETFTSSAKMLPKKEAPPEEERLPVMVGAAIVLLDKVTVLSSRTTMPVCPGRVIVQFPIEDFPRNVQTLVPKDESSKKLM